MSVMLDIINETIDDLEFEQPGNEPFRVDNDQKAEWALAKLREEEAEVQRIINVCNSMIIHYQNELRKAEEDLEKRTAYFKAQLESYFEIVDKRRTKTQETYKLPSGTLKRKYPRPQFKRDDKALVKWLKDRELIGLIKTKESPDWAELKKAVQIAGKNVVDENGEIIDGVEVVDRPPTFEVEL